VRGAGKPRRRWRQASRADRPESAAQQMRSCGGQVRPCWPYCHAWRNEGQQSDLFCCLLVSSFSWLSFFSYVSSRFSSLTFFIVY
jgi:hypothetical protein